jgi:hypothetical protein
MSTQQYDLPIATRKTALTIATEQDKRLVRAFYKAALFLIDRIKNDG